MARVLVIDDQEPIRRIVRRALEMEQHDVLEATDGAMGVRLLREAKVDVVITDIFMPGQDGIMTLMQIRKQFPGVRVIAMSGGGSMGDLDLREGAELLGARKTLQKPFTARDVLDAVRDVLKDEKE
jgi:CheY-like chemotaxis protein